MLRPHQEIGRITLSVLFIGGLIVGSFWVLKPFLPALLWAITLVIPTWPLMKWIEHRAHRKSVAVLIMTLVILAVVIVPFWLAVSTVVTNIDRLREMLTAVLSMQIPPPPAWLAGIPLVGERAVQAWTGFTASGVQDVLAAARPYAGTMTQWFATAAGSLGAMFLNFLLTTAIAAVLYANGESAAAYMLLFGRRLAGDRGERAIELAGRAIKSVALGVVVTALTQSIIAGVGLVAVGLPFAGVLTAVIFVLCLVQLGPALVMLPAVAWLYYTVDWRWGTLLLLFTIVASTIDQVIRPVLIRRGAALPLLLVLAGVIGGLIAFGVLGIFLGPVVLAVTYTLLNAWLAEARGTNEQAGSPDAP